MYEYATPTVAPGGVAAVNTGTEVVVSVIDAEVTLPAVLLACTVNVEVPAVVGFPDSTPLEFNVNPAGNVPEALNDGAGLPEAANVYEYATPTVAPGGETAVNTGATCVALPTVA